MTSNPPPRDPPTIHDARPRDARPDDNAALLELAAACPMRGDVSLRVDREPDFFALNRLEGERWRVGVASGLSGTAVAGCVAVAERRVFVNGEPRAIAYAGDLKVHPAHRGGPVADALEEYTRDACRAFGGDDMPSLLTILAGNRSMEQRASGPRGLPAFSRFATIRSHSIPIAWSRAKPSGSVNVYTARPEDLEEMAAHWARVAPQRQFAPVHDAPSLAKWIAAAPGLSIDSYWIARHRGGRMAGFLAAWDQSSFKQLHVTAYSPRLAAVRAGFNAVAPLCGATPLPPASRPLRCITAAHICVPGEDTAVLRALLLHVYASMRGKGYSVLNVGLDVRDPLSVALQGLLAQPTDIHAYITTPAGQYRGPALEGLPLHHEIALV